MKCAQEENRPADTLLIFSISLYRVIACNCPTVNHSRSANLFSITKNDLQKMTIQNRFLPLFISSITILAILLSLPLDVLNAQSYEEAYDPCATEAEVPPGCQWGAEYRLCEDFEQWPCHEIYCLGGEDSIPPDFGLPGNGIISYINFEINGEYKITQNMTFNYCNFKMRPGASIVLAPTASTATIAFNNCKFFSCNSIWRGITVNASGTSHLSFSFIGCEVEDAYIGLTLDEGKPYYYSIFNNTFRNNNIGISNRKQTGGLWAMINAVMAGNTFTASYDLPTIPVSMQSLPMPFHPNAYAGINYVRARSTIGPLTPSPTATVNTFSCMVYGIRAEECTVISNNNDFLNMREVSGESILALDGSMQVAGCHFDNAGYNYIHAEGADLTARDNHFEGSTLKGIWSRNNLNAENILIEDENIFDISTDTWTDGIDIWRSTASTGVHTRIRNDNTFNVSNGASSLSCILVNSDHNAVDEMHIDENIINVSDNDEAVHGINVWFGDSEGTKIRGNDINYSSTSLYGSFGISLNSFFGMTDSNEVRENIVTGTSNVALHCSIHSLNLEGTEFCENTVDYSRYGLHFLGDNDVELRENHMNHHDICLYVEGTNAQIGKQYGRGNTWSTDPDDCVVAAAQVIGTALFSEFRIRESNTLPFLPPNNKIIPTGTPPSWFTFNGATEMDYCEEYFGGGPVSTTPYEHEAVLGTSTLAGVPLWDLKRKTYRKLLMHPGLRPGSSAEETFYNGLASTTISYFGQVDQMISNSLSLSANDQEDFDNYREAIFQSWADIDALDATIDFSDPNNLTGAYFDDRADLLEVIAQKADTLAALENNRNQQTSQDLQSALTYNTNITTSQTYETARKLLNNIKIRHLLHEPMTQTLYQQIIALAQQDAATKGSAVDEVVPYLAPCDRVQFMGEDESEERSEINAEIQHKAAPAIRLTPNPSSGMMEVTISDTSVGTLKVFNASGQLISVTEVEQNTNIVNLNLTGFPPGIYLVMFCDVNGLNTCTSKISLTD